MPDLLLAIIVFMGLIGAIAAFCSSGNEPGLILVGLCLSAVVGLDIWWWASAYAELQTHPTKLVESFPIQTITLDDGSKYQIYIDYDSGQIHNVTRRWNKIVPDGTMVVRLEIQGRWAKNVRFFMPSDTRDELRGPLDDRWDGPPNERIENDN